MHGQNHIKLAFILKQFIVADSIYLYYTVIELFKEPSILIATQNIRPCIWIIDRSHQKSIIEKPVVAKLIRKFSVL